LAVEVENSEPNKLELILLILMWIIYGARKCLWS